MSADVTIVVPAAREHDHELVNVEILQAAEKHGLPCTVHVDYEHEGDDIVRVSETGEIEVIDDGSATV